MRKAVRIFGLSITALSLLFVHVSISQAATTDATLSFNPSSDSTTVGGSNVTYVARVNPGSNTVEGVNVVQMDITFVPSVVHLVSVTAASPFTILIAPDVTASNVSGTLSVALFIPASQVTTTSDVATLVFSPQGAGNNSSIAYAGTANAYVNDGSGTAVVATRTGATVTVTDASDVTPPVLSAGSPSSALSAGTTSTTVSVTTNENADCRYSTSSGVAYASMTSDFTTGQGTTAHSFTASGLTDGGNYGYFVRCQDPTGNPDTSDYSISFSVSSVVVSTPPSTSSSSSHHSSKKKSTAARTITNSKKTVTRGVILTQRGKKFSKNAIVALYFTKPGGGYYAPQNVKTSSTGAFMLKYRVTKPKGSYGWYALDTKTGKKSKIRYYTVK